MTDEPKPGSMEYLPTSITTEAQQADVVDFIKSQKTASARFDRRFKEDCFADFKYLQNILPDGWDRRFFTQSFQPETQIASRTGIKQIMSELFSDDNFFDLWGNDGQEEVGVELMREKMKTELLRSQYKVANYFWGMETLNFGNGVQSTLAEPQWVEKSTTEPIIDPGFGIQIGTQNITRRVIDMRFRMRTVSRFDCFPYPGYFNDIQMMPFFIVRDFVPLAVFKQKAKWKRWRNAEKVQGKTLSERANSGGNEEEDFEIDNLYTRLTNTGWDVSGADAASDAIKFVELWYYYEAPPGGTGCRAYAVVADGQHLMCSRTREYEHAMKPIADLVWHPIDSQLWQATGVPRSMRPFQDQINVREAMYSDLMEYYRNPMRIAGPNLGIKPLTRLLPRPGQIISSTGDPTALRLLEMPPPPQGLFQMSDRAHIGIERATLTDARGVVGPGASQDASNTTARGKQIYTDNQAKLAAFITLFFETRGIEPQLQQYAGLCQQFANPEGETLNLREKNEVLERAGMVRGGRVIFMPPDIAGSYTFRAVGSVRTQDTPEMAAQLQEFAMTLFSDPELAKKYSKTSFVKKIYEMTFHRPISQHEKTKQEIEEEGQQTPPLPDVSLVKYEKAPRAIQQQIEQREGFQPAPDEMTLDQQLEAQKAEARLQENDAKALASTVSDVVKAHAQPAPQPKPGKPQPVGA